MVSFVLDNSITMAWFMPDEKQPAISRLLDDATSEGVWVPGLWRLEAGNALLFAEQRKRITKTQRQKILQALEELPISEDMETSLHAWSDTITLAEKFHLTIYDAAYLELALRRGLPLATLDKDLRKAAKLSGVAILG